MVLAKIHSISVLCNLWTCTRSSSSSELDEFFDHFNQTDRVVDSESSCLVYPLHISGLQFSIMEVGQEGSGGDSEVVELDIEGCAVCFVPDRSMWMKPKSWCTSKAQKTHLWSITCTLLTTRTPGRWSVWQSAVTHTPAVSARYLCLPGLPCLSPGLSCPSAHRAVLIYNKNRF